jgi:RimJ/RimL family protein N-acetyltransferase
MDCPDLGTTRIKLDAARNTDRWALWELLGTRDASRGLTGGTRDHTIDDATRLLEARNGPVPLLWMIRLPRSSETLGFVTLQGLDADLLAPDRLADIRAPYELSVVLAPDVWGCGYAVEAAQLALGFAFGRLLARSVGAVCHADNGRGQAMLQRLGFINIGDRAIRGAHSFAFLLMSRDFRLDHRHLPQPRSQQKEET